MTHCPFCKSKHLIPGYGFAAGGLGSYVFCGACGELLEHIPDHAGTDDDPHPIVGCDV